MQKMRANSVDMLNGPLLPNIWVFSVPLMLTNLLQMLFQAADTVVVGRFAGQHGIEMCGSISLPFVSPFPGEGVPCASCSLHCSMG